MRTRFKIIKAFTKQTDAEGRMKKLLKEFPDGQFSILRKTPDGKYKTKYILRQVVRKGSKTR